MEKDGTFHEAKPINNGEVGMEVPYELKEKKRNSSFFPSKLKLQNRRMVAIVAAFLLILVPIYAWHDGNRAYALVNIDINPSIEMKINDDMKVIEMSPLNDEAELLINEIGDWERKPIEKVTVRIIEQSKEKGFISESRSVLIGVNYLDEPKKDKYITSFLEKYFLDYSNDFKVATYEIPENIRKEAHKQNKSMNELMADSIEESKTNTGNAQENKFSSNKLGSNDKAIIQSFYNNPNKKSNSNGQSSKKVNNESGSDDSKSSETKVKDKNPPKKEQPSSPKKGKLNEKKANNSSKPINPKDKNQINDKPKKQDHKPPGLEKQKDKKDPPGKGKKKQNKKQRKHKDYHKNQDKHKDKKEPPGQKKKD